VSAKEIKRQAEEADISVRTLKRSKHSLGVEARREGGIAETGQWFWTMPKGANGTLRGPVQNLAPLVPLDDFRHFSDGETPKGANYESGTLSGHAEDKSLCPREAPLPSDSLGDGDPCEDLKDASLKLEPEPDEYPELPACLDRRPGVLKC
jgi:hypothetical protein